MDVKQYLVRSELHQKDKVDIALECMTIASQENCDDHEYFLLNEASQYINFLRGHIASTGIRDRNGRIICFGDTMRFADKEEWYRSELYRRDSIFTSESERREALKKLPFEERVVESVRDYEWLLLSEIQVYWEVVKPLRHRCR